MMPLIKGKSQAAFNSNVKAELSSNKPIKQALAIAYSQKRRSDILPKKTYKNTIQSYGLSSLKNENGAVTSPQQAKQIASQRSGQSENKQTYDRYGVRRK